jgi:hypothetical protein
VIVSPEAQQIVIAELIHYHSQHQPGLFGQLLRLLLGRAVRGTKQKKEYKQSGTPGKVSQGQVFPKLKHRAA